LAVRLAAIAMRTVADVPSFRSSAPVGVADAEMFTASLAHRPSLQESGALSRRRRARCVISSPVGLEDFEVLLKSFPSDVTGMGVRDISEPVIVVALLLYLLLAIQGAPIASPSVDVGARIARIVQRA